MTKNKDKRKMLFSGQFGKVVRNDIFQVNTFCVTIFDNGDVKVTEVKVCEVL